ncbi:MAG: PTS ascorbate transporter subunit IIC [Brochothrix thermosphacta]|uniref:PTS ascorbate transporter subunit IIC n=1 Tax=Brochothrix TaxID=2755 RepID=UPI00083F98F5|nr:MULTISPECIES: PTS ascorbate transporter subunit IIC [Brochothrix]ANZ97408.1 PTS ascorbate transporter subunit IIC [Brochothrix thermosphacta]MBR5526239.1 PTS ascorbate transporter subunit IIC [Brochothrix sp.]ODJ52881.1 PTS ascorbate transporter subunit IIC [Brochothrix thermosphacta]ODJ62009.1 PTS ascorbate transporter subunit IIC [Brochothrix thermosphacta]WKK69804.1 PTS ascorbate transporter subunit IIC [Brochothrix thermosphacta]
MKSFLNVLIDVASTPAILVALIAVLGLVLQKKSTSDIFRGGIKTFVGFLVVTAGAGVVQASLEPFGEMFKVAFNMQGVVPNNEAIVAIALTKFGTSTALIMLIGMIFNVLIARFTRFKYIYLTGHATLYMSCMIAVILSVTGFTTAPLILLGGLALGIVNTLSPAILQPFMKKITGNDTVALGHTGGVGYALSGLVGKLFGTKSKSTEDINFPKGLAFLRDSTVSITITMGIIYIIVALFTGSSYITENLSGGTNYLIYALQQAGTFAAGVFVILSGVRLILAEIVPAFKGISEKLVPNAKPALDCPIIFPYAPNAVLIGFFSSFAGGIVSMMIMIFSGGVIIIPGVVPHFFCGATAGVFGNSTGGLKGAIFGSFIQGILISFLPVLLMPVLGNLGFADSTFSDADYGIAGIFLGGLSSIGGKTAVIIGIMLVLAVMFVLTYMKKNKNTEVIK